MSDSPLRCLHCSEPVSNPDQYPVYHQKNKYSTCCVGCQAIAQNIIDQGLWEYYEHKEKTTFQAPEMIKDFQIGDIPSIKDADDSEFKFYDLPDIQKDFVSQNENGANEATLVVEGIHCAACTWLIEHRLQHFEGMKACQVNLASHRVRIEWDQLALPLSQILLQLQLLGYEAHPYHPDTSEKLREKQQKSSLTRLGVAALGMMQIMMMTFALYFGDSYGISSDIEQLFHWASLIIATPILFYSAQPFFSAAWKNLKIRHLSMEVPVSLAIAASYIASLKAIFTGEGTLYLESMSMFVCFLLASRYLESQARYHHGQSGNALLKKLPAFAFRLPQYPQHSTTENVPSTELQAGDYIRIRPGDTIPADGIIAEGNTEIDESMLTGEFLPQTKTKGQNIAGGSINVSQAIILKVTKTGQSTQLSTLVSLLERAQSEKPAMAQAADRIAQYFVQYLLIFAFAIASFWAWYDASKVFEITLAVLVVTCPCALSLATPTAWMVSTQALRDQGFLITRSHLISVLAKAKHIFFDKTGTLTTGKMSIHSITCLTDHDPPLSEDEAISIAASLESVSTHPIANAFKHFQPNSTPQTCQHLKVDSQGVQGEINQRHYRLGHPQYALQSRVIEPPTPNGFDGLSLLLTQDNQPIAWFFLTDPTRPSAKDVVNHCHHLGLTSHILSGDQEQRVLSFAQSVDISSAQGSMSPQNKQQVLQQYQDENTPVIMIGDGLNDLPVLGAAQGSIVMGSGTDLTQTQGDGILLNNQLQLLPKAIQHARRTLQVTQQNFMWAIGYNLTVLPLAAAGILAPWMAALGMSLSSLLVVGNALRLRRIKTTSADS